MLVSFILEVVCVKSINIFKTLLCAFILMLFIIPLRGLAFNQNRFSEIEKDFEMEQGGDILQARNKQLKTVSTQSKKKVFGDGAYIELGDSGELRNLEQFGKFTIDNQEASNVQFSQDVVSETESFLRSKGYIANDYDLESVYNPIDNLYEMRFQKRSNYGTKNLYDSIKVGIDFCSKKIVYFKTNNDYPYDPKPELTADQASEIGAKEFEKAGFSTPQKTVLCIKKCKTFFLNTNPHSLIIGFAIRLKMLKR